MGACVLVVGGVPEPTAWAQGETQGEAAFAVIRPGDDAGLQEAVAAAAPGDTILLEEGVWRDRTLVLEGRGTRAKPIAIRARVPGGVVFSGASSLVLKGESLVLEGLAFRDGFLAVNPVILLDGTRLRLVDTVIDNYNPPDPRTAYSWVALRGRSHEVVRCTFRGKNHAGAMVEVIRRPGAADHHIIRDSYFGERRGERGSADDWATIRIGNTGSADSSSYTVLDGNLFEACDGGAELISSQAGGNTFRYNTFRRCRGAVSLRAGRANLVEGNFFLGDSRAVAGAIELFGSGHIVINNYIEAVGSWEKGAISVGAGVPDSPPGGYEAAQSGVVAFNTIVDAPGPFIDLSAGLGTRGRTVSAPKVTIANNLFLAMLYTEGGYLSGEPGNGLVLEGNLVFGREAGELLEDVLETDPLLVRDASGILRPRSNSPVLAAAKGSYRMATQDIDGQRRGTMKAIGADEVGETETRRTPLTAGDTGAKWFRAEGGAPAS